MAEREYQWWHGWVPRTMHAAMLKAHGRPAEAEELLQRSKAAHGFVTPLHAAEAEHHAKRALRALSDDQLADAMGADDVTDAELDVLVAELDRRDRAARKAQRERERRAARRRAAETAAEAEYDRRVDAGEEPEAAYAAAYGVSEERLRRDEAIASLRGAGYTGKGLEELCRAAYADHVDTSFWAAEAVTNGYMVNRAGAAAKIAPRSLFTGPESRARKYASEELLRFWQDNGRMTVEDFRAGVLGGHMRHKGAAAWS